MTDNRTDGLDDAIRSLVARAVADAPPAPVIDEQTIAGGPIVRSIGSAPSARNRWIVGSIAALTTAAAVIAIALVARPDSAEAPAPATLPPATALTTVPTALTPTLPPATTPPVVEGTAPPSTTVAGTFPPATPPSIAPPPELQEVIVVAGDDGVQIDTGDALTDAVLGESVQMAVRTGDGELFFQLRDTGTLVRLDPTAPAGSPVTMPEGFYGDPILHDAAVVNGEVVLLVESTPAQQCVGGDGCLGSVWAIWPDRGEGVILDEQNVWEAAWSRLSLSDTGLAVGTFSAEVSVSLWSMALPGTDVATLDPAAIGVEPVYSDCNTCPRAFTIDSTGRYVGWLQTRDDGSLTITAHDLTDGWTFSYDIPDASDLPTFGWLDIGRIDSDESGLVAGTAIINDSDPTSANAAHVYDLSTGGGEPTIIGKPASRMAFGY